MKRLASFVLLSVAGGVLAWFFHPPKNFIAAKGGIERVSSDDLMSLVSSRGATPMVGAVLMLSRGADLDPARVIALLERRISTLTRLRQRLEAVPFGCGRPVWVDDPHFRVSDHVSVLRCPAPGGKNAVLELASKLLTTPLEPNRALWAALLVTDVEGGRAALIVTFHHVLADGLAGLAVLAGLMDDSPPPPALPASQTHPRPTEVLRFPSKSARDLLFYLLSHPEGRSKEVILETLWQLPPDPTSFNRFRVTAHRLRAALGSSDTLLEQFGRYHLSNEVLASSDVNTLYKGLERGINGKNADERRAGLDEAVGVYRGDYLPDFSADWVLEAREEHRAGYVRARLERAGLHCDGLNCDASIEDLTLAAETDPYLGEHHQQELLACLSTVRGVAAATEHCHRFARLLRSELDDAPLEETQALIKGIREGAPARGHQIGADSPCPRRQVAEETPLLELHTGDVTALYAELERRELLLQLTEGLLGMRDPADIVRFAFPHLGRQLDAKSVLMFELEFDRLRPNHTWGEGTHQLEQQPDLTRLLTSGTPFFEALIHRGVAYYSRVPNLLAGTGWGDGVGELALEPVRAAGGATWVLAVVRPPSEFGWQGEEKALLHRIARSVLASAGRGIPARA